MAKDRFQDLQENIEKYGDGVDISIINHFAVIDMEAPFMDGFFIEVGALRNTIDKIIKLIDDVDDLQHAMLRPQIVAGIKEKLEEKMAEIKVLGHHVRMKLQRMKRMQEMQGSTGDKNVRQRITECQIEGITKYFCAIMDKYYQSVIIYRQRCIGRIRRQDQLVKIVETDEEIEEVLHKERLTMFPEIIIETEQAKQEFDEMELHQQETDKLENSIRDLHDMFFDIHQLISFQDDQINHIEHKIRNTEDKVRQWSKPDYPRKVSGCFDLKKKICLIFGFIIITIISIVYLIEKFMSF